MPGLQTKTKNLQNPSNVSTNSQLECPVSGNDILNLEIYTIILNWQKRLEGSQWGKILHPVLIYELKVEEKNPP